MYCSHFVTDTDQMPLDPNLDYKPVIQSIDIATTLHIYRIADNISFCITRLKRPQK